jgi:hypothetical protein
MLVNAPDPELSRRFIEFTLSVDGQSLWQFPPSPEGLGPRQFALRRLPVNRAMYDRFADRMIDRIDPYAEARPPAHPDRAMRTFIAPLFAAMAMDTHPRLVAAWDAIVHHPGYPKDQTTVVTAAMVDDPELRRMLEAFDAMPSVQGPDGRMIALDTPEGRAEVKAGWLRDGWKNRGLWPPDAEPQRVLRQYFTDFFSDQYQLIIDLGHQEATTHG